MILRAPTIPVSVHEPFRYSSGQTLPDEMGAYPGQLGATTPQWTGSGLYFDGGDYVKLDDRQMYSGGAFTIFMAVTGAAQNNFYLYSEGNSASNSPFFGIRAFGLAGSRVGMILRGDNNVTLADVLSNATVFDSTPHTFAFAVDGAGGYRLFVDGNLDKSGTVTRPTMTLNRSTLGGAGLVGYSLFFTGTIHALVRHQAALTANEIAAMHADYRDRLAAVGVTLPAGPARTIRAVRGPTAEGEDFTLSSTRVDEVISGTPGAIDTIDDSVYEPFDPATVDHQQRIEVSGASEIRSVTNLDTAVGSLGEDWIVRRVTDGRCRILVRDRYATKKISVPLSRTAGQTGTVFQHFVTGSIARHCADAIDSRIAGKTAETMPLFAGGLRSAACWAADLDWTGYCTNVNATAISRRHVYSVEHISLGSTAIFKTADDQTVTRTITSTTTVGPGNGTDGYATDIRIGLLDSDLPASIKHYKVPPANLISVKMPGLANGIPSVCFDAQRKAHVHEWGLITSIGMGWFYWPTEATRSLFFESIISGDSGSPSFLIINGEPVLICAWTFGGGGGGVPIHLHLDAIDAAMTSLGGGYTTTVADLSGFPSYS